MFNDIKPGDKVIKRSYSLGGGPQVEVVTKVTGKYFYIGSNKYKKSDGSLSPMRRWYNSKIEPMDDEALKEIEIKEKIKYLKLTIDNNWIKNLDDDQIDFLHALVSQIEAKSIVIQ